MTVSKIWLIHVAISVTSTVVAIKTARTNPVQALLVHATVLTVSTIAARRAQGL
jgi:hypothetical protein